VFVVIREIYDLAARLSGNGFGGFSALVQLIFYVSVVFLNNVRCRWCIISLNKMDCIE
jgi:hypothetical protein